jgi:hypothetical protein
MNRSVSEEVLDIQREMNEAHQGMRRTANTSSNMPGKHFFSTVAMHHNTLVCCHISVILLYTQSATGRPNLCRMCGEEGVFLLRGGYSSFLE